MKVLVFTSLYPNNVWPNHGVFVRERTAAVAKTGACEIRVVGPVPYYPPVNLGWRSGYARVNKSEIVDGLEVEHPRYLMIPKFGMLLQAWMMFVSVLPTVRKIRKQFKFDLIDAHYVYPDGVAAVLLGRYFGKPVVISGRGSDLNVFSKLRVIRRFLQYALKRADQIIAVSATLRDVIVELGIPKQKISVIPNGVDRRKFYPVSKSQARQTLGIPNHSKLLLSVGSLTSVKGFDLLIQAVKIVVEDFGRNDLLLCIVGEGPLRKQLADMISDSGLGSYVRLVGSIPHAELYLWYSAADLSCLASISEGWPNVVLESLACGTPVVATSVGGIPEIIKSQTVGLLVDRNERRVAETIHSALNKTWDGDAIVRYAREHSWDSAASCTVQVFESALNGGITNPKSALGQLPTKTSSST